MTPITVLFKKTEHRNGFTRSVLVAALTTVMLAPFYLCGQSIAFDYKGDTSRIPGEITLTLKAGKYELQKDSQENLAIHMSGFYSTSSPGDPVLPSRIYNVAVPPNIDWKTIKLEIEESEAELLVIDGKHGIKPEEPFEEWFNDSSTYLEWGQGKRIVGGRNMKVYEADAYWPEKTVSMVGHSQMRKWKFLKLEFSPMQYNPVEKTLRLVKTVKVRISFKTIGRYSYRAFPELHDTMMDAEAREAFINFRSAREWYNPSQKYKPVNLGFSPSLAIITTNAIVTGSGTGLADYISHKEEQGFNVILVTENDYGSLAGQPPNHTAEKIRQWLKENYLSEGIRWVLLMGNPDPFDTTNTYGFSGDVPMQMCWSRRVVGAPNDAFYSNLTSNWDLDGDGFYGEREAIDNPLSPDPAISPESFSVRWTGKIESAETGSYQFTTLSDEAVRLIINGQTVIDHLTPHYGAVDNGSITLNAGDKNDIVIEFKDIAGDALFSLVWKPPSASSADAIPATSLYHLAGASYVSGGLTGNYFNNEDFTNLAVSRIDADLKFFWGTGDSGPGGVDFTPDVYVGRIPVYNNDYAALNEILAKTIAYEDVSNIPNWRKKALMPMQLACKMGEYLKNDYLIPADFDSYRIYMEDFDINPPPEATPCNSANVLAEWPNGYGLVVMSAHGGATGIGKPTFFTSSDCSQLDDTKPCFTFQAACNTGNPENQGNLGFSLLRHGAVATVSASRQSGGLSGPLGHSFVPSPTNGLNPDLAYYYAGNVVQGIPAGKALAMTLEPSTYWPNNMIYNLYGDPTISLLGIKPSKFPRFKVSCHPGGVFWVEDEYGFGGVMIVDIIWCDPYWWIKRPYDPWELDFQIGYNTARTPGDVSLLGESYAISSTLDLRYTIPLGKTLTPYLGAGPGFYYLGVTDTPAFGLNGCAGLDIRLSRRLSLELGGSYNYLFDQTRTNFVQVTVGLLVGIGR